MNNEKAKTTSVFFSDGSFLKIKGKTNVSRFECEFDMNTIPSSIPIDYNDYESNLKFKEANLELPNIKFDCGGRGINKDFNKLLNTDAFPKIDIHLQQISEIEAQPNHVQAMVDINICGLIKTYTIPIAIDKTENLTINGSLPINIKDFNLEAPKKIMGIVKVLPEIEIVFCLKIECK